MSAVFLGEFEVGSPEWHAARAPGLGGSEIAAVLGLSPYESEFSLWHRKAGIVGPQPENTEMEWGKRLEAAVCQKFADNHPALHVPEQSPGTFAHQDRPWQVANPDRIASNLDGEVIVEAKMALFPDGWGDTGTDKIPVYYRAQVLWYLDVFGLDIAHVAVLIGGHDYREYTIRANESEQAFMREAAQEFLRTIAADERPDIDESARTYEVIREMHPLIANEDTDLPDDIGQPYILALEAAKYAEEEKQRMTSVVADLVGGGRRAMYGGRSVAVRVPGRGQNDPYLRANPLPKTIVTNIQKAA